MKRTMVANGSDGKAVQTHVACALFSAAISIFCCNPTDVVRTRVYNAPPGWYRLREYSSKTMMKLKFYDAVVLLMLQYNLSRQKVLWRFIRLNKFGILCAPIVNFPCIKHDRGHLLIFSDWDLIWYLCLGY